MVPTNEIQSIISTDNTELLVRRANEIGKHLQEIGLTTSQIRALFGEVRQIQGQWNIDADNRQKALRRLHLLKPKMAYRAEKEGDRRKPVRELVVVLDPALDAVLAEKDPKKQDDCFKNFVDFFEAILAYHKSYGGR